jgi:hypothetical protein
MLEQQLIQQQLEEIEKMKQIKADHDREIIAIRSNYQQSVYSGTIIVRDNSDYRKQDYMIKDNNRAQSQPRMVDKGLSHLAESFRISDKDENTSKNMTIDELLASSPKKLSSLRSSSNNSGRKPPKQITNFPSS